MTFNFITRVFISALTISGTLALTSEFGLSQTQPIATTFRCVALGSGYATVAQRGERVTSPMITWNSTAFGPEFTPQRRCEIVSERLTQAVAAHGGKLRYLRLTHGTICNNPVICYINNPNEDCNSNNLLLTLNQSDTDKVGQILKQLVNFSVNGTGNVSRGRTEVELGIQVENALGTGGTSEPPHPTTSVTQPQPSMSSPVPSTVPATAPPAAKPSGDNGL